MLERNYIATQLIKTSPTIPICTLLVYRHLCTSIYVPACQFVCLVRFQGLTPYTCTCLHTQVFDKLLNGDIWKYGTYVFNITGTTNYYNFLRDGVRLSKTHAASSLIPRLTLYGL